MWRRTGRLASALRNTLMRVTLLLVAAASLSACAAATPGRSISPVIGTGVAPPAPTSRSQANATTSASATKVTIPGCCSFTVPAEATVVTPSGITIDGFPQYTLSLGDESVSVEPLLGSYGWLGAQGGAATRIDERPARERRTTNQRVTVAPLRARIGGREDLMSLQVRSNCGSSGCALHQAVVGSFKIEERWKSQSGA